MNAPASRKAPDSIEAYIRWQLAIELAPGREAFVFKMNSFLEGGGNLLLLLLLLLPVVFSCRCCCCLTNPNEPWLLIRYLFFIFFLLIDSYLGLFIVSTKLLLSH